MSKDDRLIFWLTLGAGSCVGAVFLVILSSVFWEMTR